MIEHEALLFPDTGPEFLAALRSTAFYAERVRSLTFINHGVSEAFSSLVKELQRSVAHETPLIARIRRYFSFIENAQTDLDALHSEGVWEPLQVYAPSGGAHGVAQLNAQWKTALAEWSVVRKGLRSANSASGATLEASELIERAFESSPPSYGDLVVINNALASFASNDPTVNDYFTQSQVPFKIAHIGYLLTLSLFAEHHALTPTSWDSVHLNALAAARALLPPRGHTLEESPIHRRSSVEVRLAQRAVERYIPRVDDLPTSELLEIRQRRRAELEALRIGIRSLATQIDISKSDAEIDLQTRDLVSRHIDPAVRDIDVALNASRRDVIAKLGTSWQAGSGAVLTMALSYAAGAPLALAASVAAAVAFGLPFYESSNQRKRCLEGCQWSLLWRLSHKGAQENGINR